MVHSLAAAVDVVMPVLQGADRGVVAILDIRRLSVVNAKHGRAAGDRVLVAVEKSLRRGITSGGCVARLPGDQFIVVEPWVDDAKRAERALLRASRVWVPVIRGAVTRASAAIGVATWNDDRSRGHVVLAAASRLDGQASRDDPPVPAASAVPGHASKD